MTCANADQVELILGHRRYEGEFGGQQAGLRVIQRARVRGFRACSFTGERRRVPADTHREGVPMVMHTSRLHADGLETTAARNALFDEDAGHATSAWHLSEGVTGQDGGWPAAADRLPRLHLPRPAAARMTEQQLKKHRHFLTSNGTRTSHVNPAHASWPAGRRALHGQ